MESHHILVVDDDDGLRSLLTRYLADQDFTVTAVPDAQGMNAALTEGPADLIVLDLMLPGEDGLSIARRLREKGDTPIIMLSARGDEIDRIVGLEVGADDYIPKPFNPRELLARIRAVLRRHGAAEATPPNVFSFGSFRLNMNSPRCTTRGKDIGLTQGEYSLLKVFAQNPDRTLSRDQLIELLKGFERSPYDRSIDVRIARLRRKIEDDPSSPSFLRTVWGKGYVFTPTGQPA